MTADSKHHPDELMITPCDPTLEEKFETQSVMAVGLLEDEYPASSPGIEWLLSVLTQDDNLRSSSS